MDAVLVVIVHVSMDQPAEMFFIQRDDMVKDLAAAISDPAFGDTVSPGRLRARLLGCQTCRIQERDNIRIELRVAIQNEVAERASLGKRLTQLLYDPRAPVGCRVMSKCRILRRACSMTKKQ